MPKRGRSSNAFESLCYETVDFPLYVELRPPAANRGSDGYDHARYLAEMHFSAGMDLLGRRQEPIVKKAG